MLFESLFFGLVFATFASSQPQPQYNASVLYEWVMLDFHWKSPNQKQEFIDNGKFIQTNCALAGVKVYGNDTYVTVPRWRRGVPATLAKLITLDNTETVLDPFPSWKWQDESHPGALRYVQSMEIDSRGWMWILDVGRLYIFDPAGPVNDLGPKLVIYDLNNDCVIREFVFPDHVLNWTNSFANDIVVDETNGFAYISDTNTNSYGGVIVYDFTNNIARRFEDPNSMSPNPKNTITINNGTYVVGLPTDGISLSHDTTAVFYSSISGQTLYQIPTKALQNFSMSNQELQDLVSIVGQKGYSDGLSGDAKGRVVFGDLANSAVKLWSPNTPISSSVLLAQDSVNLQWPDTFGWVNDTLYFTSNKLQLFLNFQMNFNGSDGSNFRILSIDMSVPSYLTGNPQPKSLNCEQ